ncbi:hypothetical protein B0H13DRAFT_1587166 [Mycena leptocephala]|nr:hypothetical protein B0H13DRAFT_1587166 [Mycena leptocephala]
MAHPESILEVQLRHLILRTPVHGLDCLAASFRGVIFASPFAVQANQTFFASVGEWQAECAKFPNAPDHFFCNPWAYSKRKSKRSEALVGEYWDAINTPDCPDWEANPASKNYSFRACYNFLRKSNPSRFREIGDLAGFLLAGDFVYAGVVQAPMVAEVGEIIHQINKGGVQGLEFLGLVQPREEGKGRSFKMGNRDEVKAGFTKLYRK